MSAATSFLNAADALVLSAICTHLDPPSLQAVARAIRAIGNLACLELQRQAIIMLQDSEAEERIDGKMMLQRLGAATRAAVAPAVVRLFKHPFSCVRAHAVLALTRLVDASALAAHAPALLETLHNPCIETRESALSALNLIDSAALAGQANQVANELLEARQSWLDRLGDELHVRESLHAMKLLELAVSLNPQGLSDRVWDVVTSALHDAEEEVRQAAHSVLACFEADTRNSLRPHLIEILLSDEGDPQVQEELIRVFGLLEGEELTSVGPLLVSVANQVEFSNRARNLALSVLETLPPQALDVHAPALLPVLLFSSPELQFAVAVTLGHLSGEGLAEHAPLIIARMLNTPPPEHEFLLTACQGAFAPAFLCRVGGRGWEGCQGPAEHAPVIMARDA
jgi:hypothetical protein